MAKSILASIAKAALTGLANKNNAAAKTAKPGQTAAKPAPASSMLSSVLTAVSSKNFETIQFGAYQWRVLERKGDTALVITEQLLAQRFWHEKMDDVKWEACSLRAYLNGEFYNSFSPDDKARIVEVTNENPNTKGVGFEITNGNPTKDKIFLLSLDEVLRYFGDSTGNYKEWRKTFDAVHLKKIPVPRNFNATGDFSDSNDKNRVAIRPASVALDAKGKAKGDIPYAWWTRSRGRCKTDLCAACVFASGKIYDSGSTLRQPIAGSCVRPALWLKM
jgi:hypothetical protein